MASSGVTSGGMKDATTASTELSANTSDRAATNSSTDACGESALGPCTTSSPQLTAGLGCEGVERVGVPDDADLGPAGQRLAEDELGHVEHLVHVRDPDDARLAQHRVEGSSRDRRARGPRGRVARRTT